MKDLDIVILVGVAGVFLLLLLLLHKIIIMQKEINGIVKEVHNYLDFLLQEEEEEPPVSEKNIGLEELQTRVIESVLGDFFP